MEKAAANQLLDCIWDQIRTQSLTKDLGHACLRKAALQLMLPKTVEMPPCMLGDGTPSDKKTLELTKTLANLDMVATVDALFGADKSARLSAMKSLEILGISESDIQAKAYLDDFHGVEALARRPRRLDERRRALRKEFDELKARRERQGIEDAEVISSHGD